MPSVSCSICWDLMTSTRITSYLPCGHVYHHDCLDKWLKTAKTCPECRNVAYSAKRIYLNLVPDPVAVVLNQELTKTTKKLEIEKIANQLQATTLKHLEEKLSDKHELLLASATRNDELKSNSDNMLLQNEKLKLELQLQEKQQILLNNEITVLRNQLQVSETANIEIITSTIAIKEYYRKQLTQISDLHSQILDLTERLDNFRSMFAATDNKLQAQLQENQIVKVERDSLLSRNTHLYQKMKILKLQSDKTFLRKIKRKYNRLVHPPSSLKSQPRRLNNDKRELLMTEQEHGSTVSTEIKFITS